ncbi:MAG: dicarboxylate/amino acid:cation symporter, partial [Planctomycetaceae bacterium]|nr:dicarboxylate/amino acid:cation symporter [Planctomycetaceae bacterium]
MNESSASQNEAAEKFRKKQEIREAAESAVEVAQAKRVESETAVEGAKKALDADPDSSELKSAYDQAVKDQEHAEIALRTAKSNLADLGEEPGWTQILENLALMLFTDNLIESAANADLLPLIVFSIVFAGMLTTLGERVNTITKIIDQANHALMSFVMLLMKVAPLGIFCLVTARLGEARMEGELESVFRSLSSFIFTVLLGLGFHAFLTLPLIYWIFTRKNPYKFMLQMSQALLTAFSTSSSSATLPVTMETAVDEAGVSRQSAEFVLPLGATVNMDGTALYEAAAAIFIAQALAFSNPGNEEFALTLGKQLTVAITATMAAIGAAGIPEAGLFTMLIVFNAVGLDPKYIAFILPVDWFLDRFRTAVICFGDSIGAAVI